MSDPGLCLWCDEPVLETDARERMGYMGQHGVEERWQHWECAARSVLGSVGHLRGKCSCFGGTEEDPPGMTKREAARATLELATTQRGRR